VQIAGRKSFDGLGAGFEGPHGTSNIQKPSDNSLADRAQIHIVQIVNTRIASYAKKGERYL